MNLDLIYKILLKSNSAYKSIYLKFIFKRGCKMQLVQNNILWLYLFSDKVKLNNEIYNERIPFRNIKWNHDFINQFTYPKKFKLFYKLRSYFDQGNDIKVCWDLSRLYFLVQKALINPVKKEGYFEFKAILNDWNQNNPFLYGVNWIVGMEVGIRAINIIITSSVYKKFIAEDPKFEEFLSKLLVKHAIFLYAFPEVKSDGTGNNHLIADYSGLFILSCVLENHKNAKKWRDESIKGLESTMMSQVLGDGANFEDSTSYHRLVLELFAYAYFFAIDYGIPFSVNFQNRLYKMFEYVATYVDSNGIAPQVGDNDSGRVLDVFDVEERDHSYLLKMVPFLFPENSSNYKIASKNNVSKYFEKAGRIKVRKNDYDLFVVLNSKHTKKSKSHSHDDATSFTLSCEGKEFIVDPGTYCYTKNLEWRNYFRSKKRHNLVLSEQELKHKKKTPSFFGNYVTIDTELKTFNSSRIVIDARTDLDDGKIVKKERSISFYNELINIEDKVEGICFSSLHLHPKCQVYMLNSKEVKVQRDSVSITISSSSDLKIEDYWYSDGYLRKEISKVLKAKHIDSVKTEISFKKVF